MGKAPSGILKVFLVLPEGEKEFYSFSCRRPQKLYSLVIGVEDSGLSRGAQKKKFLNFFSLLQKIPQLAVLGAVGW